MMRARGPGCVGPDFETHGDKGVAFTVRVLHIPGPDTQPREVQDNGDPRVAHDPALEYVALRSAALTTGQRSGAQFPIGASDAGERPVRFWARAHSAIAVRSN